MVYTGQTALVMDGVHWPHKAPVMDGVHWWWMVYTGHTAMVMDGVHWPHSTGDGWCTLARQHWWWMVYTGHTKHRWWMVCTGDGWCTLATHHWWWIVYTGHTALGMDGVHWPHSTGDGWCTHHWWWMGYTDHTALVMDGVYWPHSTGDGWYAHWPHKALVMDGVHWWWIGYTQPHTYNTGDGWRVHGTHTAHVLAGVYTGSDVILVTVCIYLVCIYRQMHSTLDSGLTEPHTTHVTSVRTAVIRTLNHEPSLCFLGQGEKGMDVKDKVTCVVRGCVTERNWC